VATSGSRYLRPERKISKVPAVTAG
jgi:hypothetical protein